MCSSTVYSAAANGIVSLESTHSATVAFDSSTSNEPDY